MVVLAGRALRDAGVELLDLPIDRWASRRLALIDGRARGPLKSAAPAETATRRIAENATARLSAPNDVPPARHKRRHRNSAYGQPQPRDCREKILQFAANREATTAGSSVHKDGSSRGTVPPSCAGREHVDGAAAALAACSSSPPRRPRSRPRQDPHGARAAAPSATHAAARARPLCARLPARRARSRVGAARGGVAPACASGASRCSSSSRGAVDVGCRSSDLESRLRDLYERGELDPIAVVLGADSLDNAVDRLDALTSVRRPEPAGRRRHRGGAQSGSGSTAQSRSPTAAAARAASSRRATPRRVARATRAARARVHRPAARAAAAARRSSRIVRAGRGPRAEGADAPAAAASVADAAAATAPASERRAADDRRARPATTLPGHTATGLPVGWGVVAVDPSVIPLGTQLDVPGYGEGVAADIGGGDQGRDHRPLVPDASSGAGLGPPHGHDHLLLTSLALYTAARKGGPT